MKKIIFILSLLFFAAFSVSAQSRPKQKKWRITVIGKHLRIQAIFQDVTDSSVILLFGKTRTKEISFSAINKIKLKPANYSGMAIGAASFLVEGVAGGIIIGRAMSKGKTGEPAAMSGVVGGIGGGLAVGITAALVNPVIIDKLIAKKFYVLHDSFSYKNLQLQLKPYCLIQ